MHGNPLLFYYIYQTYRFRQDQKEVGQEKQMWKPYSEGTEYRHIRQLEALGPVTAIYTRKGWDRWPCNVFDAVDNYGKLGAIFGIGTDRMVRIPQTHTSNVRTVSLQNGGEGILRQAVEGYDGMVTNDAGLMLCTVEADCVPVYLYDPFKQAIGMIHSGWRGCAGRIAEKGVEEMCRRYGSKPENIAAALGPCICGKCYEVGAELQDAFAVDFSEITDVIFTPGRDGKFYLDLPAALRYSLRRAELKEEHIFADPVCTYEAQDLCSWRREHDRDARMLTAIFLHDFRDQI